MMDYPGRIRLPDFILSLGTQSLSAAARDCLTGLRVHQRLSMPAQCELSFELVVGPHEKIELVDQLQPGVSMAVTISGQEEPLFEGKVSAVQYRYGEGDRLNILARGYDFLHQLRLRQDVGGYPQITLAGLAKRMLKASLNQHEVMIHPGSSFTWPLLIQHQQNNLEFLTELAAQEGRYLWAKGTRLYMLSLAGLPADALPLTLGDNLLAAEFEVNTAETCDEVEVVGWSTEMAAVQRQVARSSQAGSSRQVGRVGERMKRRSLLNESTQSGRQAQALAQAELDRRRMSENTLWGKVTGDSRLHPGTPVEVRNVVAPAAGRYVITEAIHILDFENGYITEVSTVPPEVAPRPRSDVATVGQVTDIDDPGGLGRVRVALPAYGEVRTDWLPSVFPGGGKNKGFVSLPNVNDYVLVLLRRENPAEGVVLGGLYAAEKPPNSEITRGAASCYTWTTVSGQKIQLNEHGDLVRLETQAGARVELNGSEIVIQGSRIDFRSL